MTCKSCRLSAGGRGRQRSTGDAELNIYSNVETGGREGEEVKGERREAEKGKTPQRPYPPIRRSRSSPHNQLGDQMVQFLELWTSMALDSLFGPKQANSLLHGPEQGKED